VLLKELFDRILIETGQFQIPDNKIELKIDRFKTLTETCLGIYNQYSPIDKHFYVNISGNRSYDINAAITGMNDVPEYIADLVPIRIAGTYPFIVFGMNTGPLKVKSEFPWEYRKPTLTVPVDGEYDLHGVFFHKIVDLGNGEYDLPTISDGNDGFINLTIGKFMRALARNRRAFTVEALPITTDASDLQSEGEAMVEKAMENLESNIKFYLAYR